MGVAKGHHDDLLQDLGLLPSAVSQRTPSHASPAARWTAYNYYIHVHVIEGSNIKV